LKTLTNQTVMNYSESFRAFLCEKREESKIASLLHECVWLKRSQYNAYKLAVTDKEIDYLTFRNDGTISFLPAGKEHKVNDQGDWSREGRQNGRPSRVIRKVLTPKAQKRFKDTDYEVFARFYQAKCEAEAKTFVIKPNTAIPDVYCEKREDGGASLNGSCMNGDRDYLTFYHLFDVDILCMYNNEGLLSGRALLWRLPEGKTFMDRVYVAREHYYEMFIDYARDQENWFWKKNYKSYDDKRMFMSNEGEFEKKLIVWTKNKGEAEWDYYPYIDTFSNGDYNSLNNYGSGEYTYNDTGGSREGDTRWMECCVCGREYPEDEMYYVDRGQYRGEYVCDNHAIHVGGNVWTTHDEDTHIVQVSGDWYEKDDDDIRYLDDEGEWVLADDAVYCERDEKYYRTEDCVEDYEGNWILRTEAYEVNGDYYHESIVNKVA